jgi:hypothetical protein
MSKIKLNNNEYPIPDSVLAPAAADFVAHLGTIAGTGMKVVIGGVEYGVDASKVAGAVSALDATFAELENGGEERLEGDGGEYYTLAPTPLSFRSTAPLNELQDVQINGVTVDPSNYTLEEGSTIVTFPIDYLKTLDVGNYEVTVASASKNVKGEFTVAAPQLNEHGFYYNQPYTAFMSNFRSEVVFFVREGEEVDIMFIRDGNIEIASYTTNGNNITVNSSMGTFTGTFSADGNSIYVNELATTFVLGDESIAADEDYIYVYKEDLGGYEVSAIDKMKASYGAIKTGINGYVTVKLSDNMFYDSVNVSNINMMIAPIIPNGVTTIGYQAFGGCRNITSVSIPDSVTEIDWGAFIGCKNLTNIRIPQGVTFISMETFRGCDSLTNIVIPGSVRGIEEYAFAHCSSLWSIATNQVGYINPSAFKGCSNLTDLMIGKNTHTISDFAFSDCTNLKSITFNGTIAQWNTITKGEDWNLNVPATHVTCTDGDVAL